MMLRITVCTLSIPDVRFSIDGLDVGFAPKLGTLDSATGHLPTDGPVIICTASYEGKSLVAVTYLRSG